MEASGVADPSNIAMTFIQPQFRDRIRLDSIISIVDADQVFAYPEYPGLQELKLKQIGFSDMVILNKVDLVDVEELAQVKTWIENRLNRVRIVESSFCDVPLEILLAVGRFDPTQLTSQDSGKVHDHGGSFSTWSFESEEPLSLEDLREKVKRQLPSTIYRCKGIVYAVESPDHRVVLQVVGRRSDVILLDEWGDKKPRTRIVAIGAPSDIDEDALRQLFESCVASP